jgi:hypothetical protein
MSRVRQAAAFATFLLFSTHGAAQEQRGLSQAEFVKLHQLLHPAKQEPWQAVPWKLSILEAQAQAAKEKKPIFMLVRSGHPLGCV